MKGCIGIGLVLGALAAGPAFAAEADTEEGDDARVEELERKVEILAEEVERLRGGEVSGDEAEAAAADDEGGRYGLGPAASKVYRSTGGVSLGGYGEWVYDGFDDTLDDGSASAATDTADYLRLVLYTGYKFTDSILFNSEIEFEHATTGEGGEVSVEFAYLDFLLRPAFNVRTGLVLVPVGFVNEIHEPTTFLSARRPDVETVILPSTWRELGAGVFGDVGPVAYRAYVTTSLAGDEFSAESGIRGGRQDASRAAAEDFAVLARVDYTAFPGLLAGVSGFRGDSGQGQTVGGETVDGTVTTFDAHVEYRWRGLETRAVWARVDVDDAEELSALAGETIGSELEGWYVEAGYDVLAPTRFHRRQLIPFVRVEEVDTQKSVAPSLAGTVTGANDREVTTVGLVFRPIPRIAVKVDRQNHDDAAGTGQDVLHVGVGFSF